MGHSGHAFHPRRLGPLSASLLALCGAGGIAWAQSNPPAPAGTPNFAQIRRSEALSPMGRQLASPDRLRALPRAHLMFAPAVQPQAAAAPAAPPLPPAVCGPVPPPASAATPRHAAEALPYRPFPATWQQTIDALVADGSIPGVVIIIKSPEWGVRVGVAGEANVVSHEKMAPDLQFRVGSVSKAFLGQAILRLEQQGKIKLTDPVTAYLGDNKIVAGIPNIDKVTIANLLQMTSGVANFLDAAKIGDSPQVAPDRHFTPDELMSVLSAAGPAAPGQPANTPIVPPYFAPGDSYPNPYWVSVFDSQPPTPTPAPYPAWNYSNSNYILLGMIAQKVTGMQPQEFLERYVFNVAGLNDTYFATDETNLPAMHGYTKYGSIPYPTQVYNTWCDVTATNPSYAWTAGAIVSTPWDLLQFEDAMFASDKLLNEGTKNKWFTFVDSDIHLGWEQMQYGVGGLMQPERTYGTARGHGGAYPGYKTLIYYFYDQKTSFVLASNTWDDEWEVTMLDQIMPQVSSAVTTPRPKNGAAIEWPATHEMTLGWQAGRIYGTSYQVYVGANADAVDRASASNHPDVRMLTASGVEAKVNVEPDAVYYWRVDTVAPGQSMPLVIGPTWSFRTR